MKLINPILQTINNTLHIKADNLEPIEVDSSCVKDFYDACQKIYLQDGTNISMGKLLSIGGINIQELADRIEVKEETTHHKSDVVKTYKAFLLPSKEDNKLITTYGGESILTERTYTITQSELTGVLINGVRYYTIEEIEKAIDSLGKNWKMPKIKEAIINNLKK